MKAPRWLSPEGGAGFLVLLFSLLLAFGLRVAFLDRQSLWGDEAYSLALATRTSLTDILEEVLSGDPYTPHTPLYYLLLNSWVGLVGSSDYALRALSAAFGLLTVPVSYVLARRLAGPAVGLLVGFLSAFSPFLVYYSQEARMYAMAGFLAMLTAYFFLRSLTGRGWAWWGAYLFASLALVFTLNLGLALVASLFLVYLISLRLGRKGRLKGLLVYLLIAVFFVAWQSLQNSRFQMVFTPVPFQAIGFLGLDTLKDTLLAFTFGVTLDRSWAADRVYTFRSNPLQPWTLVMRPYYTTALAAGAAALASLGMWKAVRGKTWPPLFIPLCLTALVTAVFLLRLTTPGYAVRLALIVAPLFILLLAIGVLALPRIVRPVALVLLLLGMGYSLWHNYFNPAFYRSEFQTLSRYLGTALEPGDGIYLHSPVLRLLQRHYLPQPNAVYALPRSVPVPQNWAEVQEQLRSLIQQHSRIWLVLGGEADYDPERRVESWLLEHGYQVEDQWYGNSRLSLFIFPRSEGSESISGRPVGKDLLLVNSATGLQQDFTPGQGLPLALSWMRLSPKDKQYRLSLRLLDSEERVWGQRDMELGTYLNPFPRWPLGQPVQIRTGLRVPLGTPPGRYSLKVLVYDSSGQPLPDGELGPWPVQIAEGPIGAASRLNPPIPSDLSLGAIRVFGYYLPQKVWPGQVATLRLYWTVEKVPADDYSLVVQFGTGTRQVLSMIPGYPTSRWRRDEALITRHRIIVPATVSGHQPLSLGLQGKTLVGPFPLAQIEVAQVRRSFEEPSAQKSYGAVLGGRVELVGADLDRPVPGGGVPVLSPGALLGLNIYWKGLREMQTSYTVFVQLLNDHGRLVAQHDSPPAEGQRPTTGWLTGEVVADRHALRIPDGLPPGRYVLIAGMYDAPSGRRLETAGGDFVPLMEVVVGND